MRGGRIRGCVDRRDGGGGGGLGCFGNAAGVVLLGPILVCGVAVLGWVVIGIGVVGVKEKEKEIFVGKGSTSKWLCLCLSEMVLGLVLGWLSRVVDG